MSSEQATLLHIGAPKSASTSLQNLVFLRSPALYHFGEVGDGVTNHQEEAVIRDFLELDQAFVGEEAMSMLIAKHKRAAGQSRFICRSAHRHSQSVRRTGVLLRRPRSLAAKCTAALLW